LGAPEPETGTRGAKIKPIGEGALLVFSVIAIMLKLM